MRVFYSPAYVAAGYAFDTTRKAGWIADSLAIAPIAGVGLTAPDPTDAVALAAVHAPAYIAAVRTGAPRALAESQGFRWDAALWPAVCASNGGAVAAAHAAIADGVAGSLSSGLHHARGGGGAGFCTFNGLALAAVAAQQTGLAPILILDLDAHCGGGTASLVGGNAQIWHLDVAVSPFDAYTPGPRGTLDLVGAAPAYLPTIAARLRALADRGPRFALCLYNAGMDPCEDCDIGGLAGITPALLAEREGLVFDWARRGQLPIAFVLAGGYTGSRLPAAGLVALHRLTLAAAAG